MQVKANPETPANDIEIMLIIEYGAGADSILTGTADHGVMLAKRIVDSFTLTPANVIATKSNAISSDG